LLGSRLGNYRYLAAKGSKGWETVAVCFICTWVVSQAALPIRFFPRVAADYTNIMHDSMTMPPTVVALDVFGGNYVKHLMQTLQSQHFSFSRFLLGNLPYPSGVCNFQTQT